MNCHEIRESFIELLYEEGNASTEIESHIQSCEKCRLEYEELRQTRQRLQLWKDEAPLRDVVIARPKMPSPAIGSYLRYAGVAAMALLCFLALANAQISWNKDGFSFKTAFFSKHETERNTYTKSEIREIMKMALDDTEFRMNETNFLMIQKMMDTVEQERWSDFRRVDNHVRKLE